MDRNTGEKYETPAAPGENAAAKSAEGKDATQKPAAVNAAAEKKRIRAAALARRDSLTARQRRDYGGRIIEKLTRLPCYEDADAVLAYVSFRSEVNTFSLLEQAFTDGKAVFVPKVLGREMDFFRIASTADLTEGYRGILEPAGGRLFAEWMIDQTSQQTDGRRDKPAKDQENENRVRAEKQAGERRASLRILLCMPGAAFDRQRHRIGYGGGFYDRYVSGLLKSRENMAEEASPRMELTAAALAYNCQIFEEIPWEAHDVCPMYLVTEREIIS